MLKSYFLIAFRNLKKYKVYSFINLVGLSIALVPVILLSLYVMYELGYDRHNENFDRIYRVVDQTNTTMPMPLAEALKAEVPEIEYAGRMRTFTDIVSYKDKRNLERNLLYADPDIMKIFTFDFVYGDRSSVLSDKYTILLSESMAKKYFGDEYPLGKVIEVNDIYQLKVTGVFKDLPETSHFSADFILPASIIADGGTMMGQNYTSQSWGFSMFLVYVMLKENAEPSVFTSKIHSIIDKYAGEPSYQQYEFDAQSLGDIHLYSHFRTELKQNGDITKIYLYSSLAAIILLIALINYVNLATARASRRVKEIGVRKIVGARKQQLVKQLLSESLILTFTASVFGYVLTVIALPYFNEFIDRHIELNLIQSPAAFLVLLGLLLLIGLAAGIYPALILSSINPLAFFNGRQGIANTKGFRGILVTLQFVLSMILIFITMVMNKQMDFVTAKDLGIETKNIINLGFLNYHSFEQIQTVKNEIENIPGVISVCANRRALTCGYGNMQYGDNKDEIQVYQNEVDYDYIDLYGLKVVQGRKFSNDHATDAAEAAIVNESAVKAMGSKNPIGKVIKHSSPFGSDYRTIIGVVKDYHIQSLFQKIQPLYLVIDKRNQVYSLSIKLEPQSIPETLTLIKDKIKQFEPDNPFQYRFLEDTVLSFYSSELKEKTLFTGFSGFTIFVACLGMFGLVSFTTEVRKKEIGIRKVLGASSYQIGGKVIKEMLKLVVIASIVALPVAYCFVSDWLEKFAYKVSISLSMFIIASLSVCFIAASAMILQVYKAAVQNPIDVIRTE